MFQNYRMRNSPRRYFEEMLRMFDIFEVKNGAMTSHHNRLVEDLMAVVREKRGAVSLVAGSDAHTLAPLARVYTVAEADDRLRSSSTKIRTGACFVWGSEMGFRMLLSDVYRMVFRYYGSVLDWKNPEFTGAEKARHLALAAVGAPFSAAGVPAGDHDAELPEADLRDEDGRTGAAGALGKRRQAVVGESVV